MALREIDAVRSLLSSKPRPVGWHERRSRIEDVGSVWPAASDIQREKIDIGGLAAEWSIAPGSDPSRVLLYFHGGGYCSGSILSHRRLVTEAGRAAKARTLAIEYRLAPEHPFPAALDDALTAWRFLKQAGIATEYIAIGGDSAGGGLTVALINQLRDAGERIPACAWLISPWTDLTLSGSTLTTKEDVDPIIHKAYLAELADAYLSPDVDREDARVSPLFADLRGLPPTLIQVGSCETLLDDSTRFAAAAGAAGVAVTLEIWPDMIHAFPMWNAHLAPARQALANAGDSSAVILRHSAETKPRHGELKRAPSAQPCLHTLPGFPVVVRCAAADCTLRCGLNAPASRS
jgi:epsilon-lactone hydrolase